jgi:hypothetical protein
VDDLEHAEAAVKSRGAGLADARNAKLHVVITSLHTLGAYVQTQAATHPIEERAAIIESASLHVRGQANHPKQDVEAVMGPGGAVVVRAHAAPKGQHAAYEWQISGDGGKTWNALPPITTVAHTSVMGLAVGTTQMFRVRITVGSTVGDWSQAVSLFIH